MERIQKKNRESNSPGITNRRLAPVKPPTILNSSSMKYLTSFEQNWYGYNNNIQGQLRTVSVVRNGLVMLLKMKKRDRAEIEPLINETMLLLAKLFQSCLQHGINFLNFKLPDAVQIDYFYQPAITSLNSMALLCIYMGNPKIDHEMSIKLINITQSLIPAINHPFHMEIFEIFIQLGDLNPRLFTSSLMSSTIKIIYPNKSFKQFFLLDEVIDKLMVTNSKLLSFDFIDAAVEMVHNNIFNSTFISNDYLNIGYSIFSKMGVISFQLGYLVQLSNICKVFQDMLTNENLKTSVDLRFHFSYFLSKVDLQWQLFSIRNLLFIAFKLNAKDVISTRTNLDVECVNFPFLLNHILPLLNNLVSQSENQDLAEFISSIYIILLNPPNVDLAHHHDIANYFKQLIDVIIKHSLIIPDECIKLTVMFYSLGLINCPKLKTYFDLHPSNQFAKLYVSLVETKLFPSSRKTHWKDPLITHMKPFFLVYQLSFFLIKFGNDKLMTENLFGFVDDELLDPYIDTLLYFKDLKLNWFNEECFKNIVESLNAYDEEEEINNYDLNLKEIAAPLYLECSESTALDYTNSLSDLVYQKKLDKDDLIIFDLFRFENVDKIKENLTYIFNTCQMSDQFINALANRVGNSELLSSIVLNNKILIEKLTECENKWSVLNGCTLEPISKSNVNCISIFTLIVSEKEYNGEIPFGLKSCFKAILKVFYSRDHTKEDKLEFWNAYAKYSMNDNGNILKKSKLALFETWQDFGFKKCISKMDNDQRIIIDNDLTVVPISKSQKKQKNKKLKNDEPIITNKLLTVSTSEGVDEVWPVTVTVYPKGKKIKVPEIDMQLRNRLFDDERKLWFLKQRKIGITKKIDDTRLGKDISVSYDYYQRILAFDLFRGIFEGQKETGVLIGSLFGSNKNFTLESINEISDQLKKFLNEDQTIHPLNALLLIEFITIFLQRDLDKNFWTGVLNNLKDVKDETVQLAVMDMFPLEKRKIQTINKNKSHQRRNNKVANKKEGNDTKKATANPKKKKKTKEPLENFLP